MKTLVVFTILLIGIVGSALSCFGESGSSSATVLTPYPEEKAAKIGRGFMALPADADKVLLTWRMLTSDATGTSFEVYRVNTSTNKETLLGTTDETRFFDSTPSKQEENRYKLVTKTEGRQLAIAETEIGPNARSISPSISALTYDLGEDYQQVRLAAGDLNGDGELEVVMQFANDKNLDPYEVFKKIRKSTDTIKVAAFTKAGKILWKMDLGPGIEAGAVYSPMILWDIDADGKAEVILKTNHSGDPTDYDSERITILNGESGEVVREAPWPSPDGLMLGPKNNTTRGTLDVLNNLSRNYLAIAHLDGKNATIIAARGLYMAQKIVAFDTDLNKKWEKLSGMNNFNPLRQIWKNDYKYQRVMARLKRDNYKGSHSLPIADIDGDGKEEILWGDLCLGEGGKELWKIKERFPYNGHEDVVFAADIDPDNAGNEIYYCREGWGKSDNNIGMAVFDNRGKLLWGKWGYTHVDGGWVAKVLPQSVGLQSYGYDLKKKNWGGEGVDYVNVTGYLWDYKGNLIREVSPEWIRSFPADWNGDEAKEIILLNGSIVDYENRLIDRLNGTPEWGGDIYGDHREEIVVTAEGRIVYICFSTDDKKGNSRITPIADRRYRNDLSRTAMQFKVVPMEGGYKYTVD